MLPKATLFILVVAMIFAHTANARSARVARAPKPALANRFNDKQCETGQTPCGWAVYIDRSRIVDYYIINCICKDDELCTKDEDDMSAKTFIYRCLVNYTNATAVVPPS